MAAAPRGGWSSRSARASPPSSARTQVEPRLAVEMLFGMIRSVCLYRDDPRQTGSVGASGDVHVPERRAVGGYAVGTSGEHRAQARGRRQAVRFARRSADVLTCGCADVRGSRVTSARQRRISARRCSLRRRCPPARKRPAPRAPRRPRRRRPSKALQITVAPVALRPTKRLLKFVGTLFGNEEVTLSSRGGRADRDDAPSTWAIRVSSDEVLLEVDDTSAARAAPRDRGAPLEGARRRSARPRAVEEQRHLAAGARDDADRGHGGRGAARRAERRPARTSRSVRRSTARWCIAWCRSASTCAPGTPLFDLVDDDPLKLRGDVPERFADEIADGQPVQIKVDAYPDVVFEGTLVRISPAANRENRSITVEAAGAEPRPHA